MAQHDSRSPPAVIERGRTLSLGDHSECLRTGGPRLSPARCPVRGKRCIRPPPRLTSPAVAANVQLTRRTAAAPSTAAAAPSTRGDRVLKRLVPALLDWFAASARELPWRRTRDAYAIWISEVMLQQTQVKTVIPYWERWMAELPDAAALARAPEARVLKLWEGLGYYSRARNLQKAARIITEKFGGRFPQELSRLLELPGVGRYTAGAICSIAFNQPAPILDGNVMRVLARVFALEGDPRGKETNRQLWSRAAELVEFAARSQKSPAGRACSRLNQSLMELGATVCTPRGPDCPKCPVRRFCAAARDGRTHELPALTPRAELTARRFVAFVIARSGRHLVRQRPAGNVNAGLWEFPNVELAPGAPLAEIVTLDGGRRIRPGARLGELRHSITRYRITLEIHRAELVEAQAQPHEHWATAAELAELAFTSAHRKIASRFV